MCSLNRPVRPVGPPPRAITSQTAYQLGNFSRTTLERSLQANSEADARPALDDSGNKGAPFERRPLHRPHQNNLQPKFGGVRLNCECAATGGHPRPPHPPRRGGGGRTGSRRWAARPEKMTINMHFLHVFRSASDAVQCIESHDASGLNCKMQVH
jgi:hypothetical protein